MLQLKNFGTTRIDIKLDTQLRADIAHHNECVRKNREVLQSLIDICFVAVHELPFHGHNEGEDSLNKGVYLGVIELVAKYGGTLSNHLETSRIFRGTSNRIQNDLILAVSEVLLKKIKEEITQCFVNRRNIRYNEFFSTLNYSKVRQF